MCVASYVTCNEVNGKIRKSSENSQMSAEAQRKVVATCLMMKIVQPFLTKFQRSSGGFSKLPKSLPVRHPKIPHIFTLCLSSLSTSAKGCKLVQHVALNTERAAFQHARQHRTEDTMRVQVVIHNVSYELFNTLRSDRTKLSTQQKQPEDCRSLIKKESWHHFSKQKVVQLKI